MSSSSAEQQFYDDVFAQVAQRAGSVESLLDEFFSFLHRRTDFYVSFPPQEREAHGGREPVRYAMGFPEGAAEQMLLRSFRRFPFSQCSAEPLRPSQTHSQTHSQPQRTTQTDTQSHSPTQSAIEDEAKSVSPSLSAPSASVAKAKPPLLTDKGLQVPVGNGGLGPNYVWTQTLRDVTVYVDAPREVRAKAVRCEISPRRLSLEVAGERVLCGDLEETIVAAESTWTLSKDSASDAAQIIITLEKKRETWWKHVIAGHPEIDCTKVDSTKNISEFDEETQGVIRKLLYEQRQKMLNKPVDNEESRLEALLQQASTSPGSPFTQGGPQAGGEGN